MKANDDFKQYTGSETMYNYTAGMVITEGAKALADKFECYWFLDIIASYQYKVKDEFQAWILTRTHNTATVECTDGNGNIYIRQYVSFTDFKADSATLWVEFKTILLPSEY
jgi:hypothetical protein